MNPSNNEPEQNLTINQEATAMPGQVKPAPDLPEHDLPPSYDANAEAPVPSAPPYDLLANDEPPTYNDSQIDYLPPPAYEEKVNTDQLKKETSVSQEEINAWWNRLTYQQQKELADNYEAMMKKSDEKKNDAELAAIKQDITLIAREIRKNNNNNQRPPLAYVGNPVAPAYCYGVPSYRPQYVNYYYSAYVYRNNYRYRHNDFLDTWLAINLIESAAYMAPYAIQGTYHLMRGAAHITASCFDCLCAPVCSGGGEKAKEAFIAIVVLAAIAAAIAAAFVFTAYTAKKIAKAFYNIASLNTDKFLSSILRLASAAGGILLGFTKGALVGALVGSAVPVVGTAAGAIIGAVLGAAFTAGAFVIISKQLARLASYIAYEKGYYKGLNNGERVTEHVYDKGQAIPVVEQTNDNVLSKTNPNKYRFKNSVLSEARKLDAKTLPANTHAGTGTTADLMDTMRNAKSQKEQINGWKSNFPLTDETSKKDEYNKLIKALKSGKASKTRAFDTGKTVFFWESNPARLDSGDWKQMPSYSVRAGRR